jgi:excisionase family DNA binding protein
MNKQLTIPEFADAVNVNRKTIEREIRRGNIKAARKNPLAGRTSPFLIPASELARWLKLQKKSAGK